MVGAGFKDAILLAAFISVFGCGAVQHMLQSLCMKSVPTERHGSASGTNYAGMVAIFVLRKPIERISVPERRSGSLTLRA